MRGNVTASGVLVSLRESRSEGDSDRHSAANPNGYIVDRGSNTRAQRQTNRQKYAHRVLFGSHLYPNVPASTGETARSRSTASGTTCST